MKSPKEWMYARWSYKNTCTKTIVQEKQINQKWYYQPIVSFHHAGLPSICEHSKLEVFLHKEAQEAIWLDLCNPKLWKSDGSTKFSSKIDLNIVIFLARTDRYRVGRHPCLWCDARLTWYNHSVTKRGPIRADTIRADRRWILKLSLWLVIGSYYLHLQTP